MAKMSQENDDILTERSTKFILKPATIFLCMIQDCGEPFMVWEYAFLPGTPGTRTCQA